MGIVVCVWAICVNVACIGWFVASVDGGICYFCTGKNCIGNNFELADIL